MSTLREAALAAYQLQEHNDRTSHLITISNLRGQTKKKIRSILGVKSGPLAERAGLLGVVTTVEGIEIWATYDDWTKQDEVILSARVWTNDDGKQWMPFQDLADLGYLLTEDATATP